MKHPSFEGGCVSPVLAASRHAGEGWMLLRVGHVLCAPGPGQMPHREAFMWGAEQSPKGHWPLLVWYGDPLSSLPSCRAIHFTWLLRLATYLCYLPCKSENKELGWKRHNVLYGTDFQKKKHKALTSHTDCSHPHWG